MNRLTPLLGAAFLALAVAACGTGAASQPSGPTASPTADSPRIVAKDIKFTTTIATAPANKAFAIDFDNQESVPHNISIDAPDGRNVFKGEVFNGSAHRVYSVPALAAGTYAFKCDVHPDMKGTLTVS
jgi:plastocyanin